MNTPQTNFKKVKQHGKYHLRYYTKTSFQTRTFPFFAIISFTIFIAMLSPGTAEAQSFWQQMKDRGERLIDSTRDKFTPTTEEAQQEQNSQALTKSQVRNSQIFLTRLGYQPGPIDGTYSATTETAIRAYQADHGLLQTGLPSDELLVHMKKTLAGKPTPSIPGERPSAPSSQSASQTVPSGSQTPKISSAGSAQSPATQQVSSQKGNVPPSRMFEVDILAPEGVSLGMAASTAKAELERRGYRMSSKWGKSTPCVFTHEIFSSAAGTLVSFSTNLFNNLLLSACLEGEPVLGLSVRYSGGVSEMSLLDFLEDTERRLGKPAVCQIRRDNSINCKWDSPPNALSVETMSVKGLLQRLRHNPAGYPFTLDLSLNQKAKNDVALSAQPGSSPPPAHTQPDKVESSTARETAAMQDTVESSATDASFAQGNDVLHKGSFDIEGVSLGMTGTEIENVLKKNGYASFSRKGPPTEFGKGPGREPGARSVTVNYAMRLKGTTSLLPPEKRPAEKIWVNIMLSPKSGKQTHEAIYQSLVIKYGEPDQCREGIVPHKRCEWSNAQGETFRLQYGVGKSSQILEK